MLSNFVVHGMTVTTIKTEVRPTFYPQIGLLRTLKELHWYEQEDSRTFYPRCHSFDTTEGIEAFIEDFRHTCAQTILLMYQSWGTPLPLLMLAIKVRACIIKILIL
jgi:hypothetical protein